MGDVILACVMFFFSSRRRHTRWNCDWSSDVCSSVLHLLHRHLGGDRAQRRDELAGEQRVQFFWFQGAAAERRGQNRHRSEEHTSELQSQFHLVCRLLLEKKKNTPQTSPDCVHHTERD